MAFNTAFRSFTMMVHKSTGAGRRRVSNAPLSFAKLWKLSFTSAKCHGATAVIFEQMRRLSLISDFQAIACLGKNVQGFRTRKRSRRFKTWNDVEREGCRFCTEIPHRNSERDNVFFRQKPCYCGSTTYDAVHALLAERCA